MVKLKLVGSIICLVLLVNSCFGAIQLRRFEKKVFSQNGEDGVIEKIFSLIGTTNRYYVEFGVQDGAECNTRNLRENYGWTGLMMDGGFSNPAINLQKEFITAENINQLFEKYNVPAEFDLLSIDIDFNDFYVWRAISSYFKPRVVVIEFNVRHLPGEDKVVVYNPFYMWDGSDYHGASIQALYKLGRQKGYSLVYQERTATNIFFVRNDIVEKFQESFENINLCGKLYKRPKYLKNVGHHPEDTFRRPWVSSDIGEQS